MSCLFGSQAYQHGILSVQVYMHIGTRLVGSQGISVATVIGFVAAADTGSSFFMLVALPYFAVFCHILPSSAKFCQVLP